MTDDRPEPAQESARRALRNAPAADMTEIVARAAQLQDRELLLDDAGLDRQAALAAADELGLSPEYLERAAQEVQERRIAEARDRQGRRRWWWLWAAAFCATVVGAAVTLQATRSPDSPVAGQPVSQVVAYSFDVATEQQWLLNVDPSSRASLAFDESAGHGRVAVITVDVLGPEQGAGIPFVNMNSGDGARSLVGHQRVTFSVRGEGLPNVRLFLEAGATERWRSPLIPVTNDWQTREIRLDQFEHQQRDTADGEWRTTKYSAPGRIERLSFKLGAFVNQSGQAGTTMIDDIRIE
jgi:hypothetical protein